MLVGWEMFNGLVQHLVWAHNGITNWVSQTVVQKDLHCTRRASDAYSDYDSKVNSRWNPRQRRVGQNRQSAYGC